MATGEIEMRVGRSPSRHYLQTRLRAAAFPGYAEQPAGGFVLRASVAELGPWHLRELDSIVAATCTWTSALATVDGAEINRFTLASALRCWATKLELAAKPRAMARHCLAPVPSTLRRTVPESFPLPCRSCLVEGARWGDFAPGGVTDHAALEAAITAAAAKHPLAWCPGFDVEPVLVQIRKLPRSRIGTRAREERAAAKAAAEWEARQAEHGRQLRELIAHEAERQAEFDAVMRIIERIDIDRGGDVLTVAEKERISDVLRVPELRLLPYVGHLSDVQRRRLGERLREAMVGGGPPDE